MSLKNKEKYDSLGFVEAMIAIMIAGISSVVLMRIAVNTMQSVVQNEAIDNMTQFAVEGAEIVQDIAKRDITLEEDIFPPLVEYQNDPENCFVFDYQSDDNGELPEGYYFKKEEDGDFVKFTKGLEHREEYKGEDGYKEVGRLDPEDEFFRIVCLESPVDVIDAPLFVVAEIVVGQSHSSGTISRGNLVKDYEYRSIIKFIESDVLDPDYEPPETTNLSPSSNSSINSMVIAGVTDDNFSVSHVILSQAQYNGGCGAYSVITTLSNPENDLPFYWEYPAWDPEDGIYCIRVQGVDRAGNHETAREIENVTYDTTPPSIDSVNINDQFELSLSSSDNLSGVQSEQIRIEQGDWLTYQEGMNLAELVGNEPGTYDVEIRVRDKAGNTTTDTSESFTIPEED